MNAAAEVFLSYSRVDTPTVRQIQAYLKQAGLAGITYALLNLYRETGEQEWLIRARECSGRCGAQLGPQGLRNLSLYKGSSGIALLLAEIDRPELARMPLFEPEGW